MNTFRVTVVQGQAIIALQLSAPAALALAAELTVGAAQMQAMQTMPVQTSALITRGAP